MPILSLLQQVIKIYEDNHDYRYENPLDYVAIYMRIINLSKKEDEEKFYKRVTKKTKIEKG